MNILFISPNSPITSIGGVERHITNLINYCKNQSEDNIYIMLPTYEENNEAQINNITLYYENNLFVPKDIKSQNDIQIKAKSFSKHIEEIIIAKKINIICAENFHVGLPPAYSLLLNMIASKHNVPIALRLHSFAKKELQKELINQLMWRKISCVSKSVTGDCFQKGANINILSTDYLGVDPAEFNTNPTDVDLKKELGLNQDNKIILTAGRVIVGKRSIIKEKGFINLIRAFSKLSPRYPHFKLLIAVGKAPHILQDEFNDALQMLNGYIKLNHVSDHTIVKEFALHEMATVYKGSDIFVLPSENETFGQVFIESMACGIPVIGTKVGGIPEIISDSYNGLLVHPDDASILAQKIELVLTNNQLSQKLILNGIKVVNDKFSATKQYGSFLQKMNELVFQPKI